jgi:hydroxypyruvate isomerase
MDHALKGPRRPATRAGPKAATRRINYPGIMRVIAETKYEVYVGQEFIPVGDIAASLADAARLCDV